MKMVLSQRFMPFEPLLENVGNVDLTGIDWAIIGAETGNRKGRVCPDFKWAHYISMDADEYDIPVFMKDNLKPYMPKGYVLRQEFPKEVK